MLYTVANDRWTPGSALEASATRTGLYRTRREAGTIAEGRRMLAVSVQYDATRGVITQAPPGGRELPSDWSAPAIVGPSGGVTVLAKIPGSLVQALGPARLRLHGGHQTLGGPRSHLEACQPHSRGSGRADG